MKLGHEIRAAHEKVLLITRVGDVVTLSPREPAKGGQLRRLRQPAILLRTDATPNVLSALPVIRQVKARLSQPQRDRVVPGAGLHASKRRRCLPA